MRYFRQYPLSLCVIAAILYLSFFRPPTIDGPEIPGLDKVVHICMYGGLSLVLWFEFIRTHAKVRVPLWHAYVGALLCPIVMSGIVEILQEYCTDYRGGDWLDFAANTLGASTATLIMRHFAAKLLR